MKKYSGDRLGQEERLARLNVVKSPAAPLALS